MSALNFLSRSQNYYRRNSASWFYKKPVLVAPDRPLISFTFDDFPKSALFTGGAILNRFGFSGTYYVSLGLAGKEILTGLMFDIDDLSSVIERGHELGCHTFSHCNSWEASPEEFEQSVIENSQALSRILPGEKFKSFSYPISLPRPETKKRTASHFLCCRAGGQTINAGESDLNQLSSFFLEKSRDNIQAVKDIIDRNRNERSWLIFATHDIAEHPTPYGCTPEFFEEVVQYAADSGAQVLPVVKAVESLTAKTISEASPTSVVAAGVPDVAKPSKPLVSILIPAHNVQNWISDTLRSAIAQTWEPKEIIVVDDGSTDQTVEVARRFEAQGVRVVSQKNQGAAAARNTAFSLSKGDYIQWLDADDLLAPDKISRQMEPVLEGLSKRTLLSSSFGKFMYRWYRTQFIPTSLWHDLSPVEWLTRKLGENLYMQTATWLVSRELTEVSGPWDTRLLGDDDGEYFCRVLLASDGVRFVPEAKTYYRAPGAAFGGSLSQVGQSDRKIKAHWLSMQLHIGYIRSLEDSERVRAACRTYLQNSMVYFYWDAPEIAKQAEDMAKGIGVQLEAPRMSWKYSWAGSLLGWSRAKRMSLIARKLRWTSQRFVDGALFRLENRGTVGQ